MKINLRKQIAGACLALIGLTLAVPALAQSHGGHGGGRGGGHGGGRGGGGWHGGGPGWWGWGLGLGLGWEAATLAYPYAYCPYAVDEYPYVAASVMVQPPLPVAPQVGGVPNGQANAPGSSWYYCESARSYYPYVAQCAESWRVVPAAPPGPGR